MKASTGTRSYRRSRFAALGDFFNGLGEGHQARTGHFIDLSLVTGLSQSRNDDVRDVFSVDEGLADGAGGEREDTVAKRIQEEALAEVLVEPACSDNGPGGIGVEDDALAALGLFLAAAGKQHQPPDAALGSKTRELLDCRRGLRYGQIRRVRHVRRRDALQCGGPRRLVVPFEVGLAGAGCHADWHAFGGELLRDPATGLAGASDDQGEFVILCHGLPPSFG